MTSVTEVRAVQGKGLEGDRYFNNSGTYSRRVGPDRQLTLIEQESLDAMCRDYEIEFDAGESRRNIVTRGIALNHLVGREFRVGGVALRGLRLCEPCGHLERVTGRPVRESLIHRGGLRAEILTTGAIRVGDPIEIVEPE
jgi:MOSC domain-containing protein YiiM